MHTPSAEEIKKAMLATGKTFFTLHECGICRCLIGYIVRNEELFFDSNCDCAHFHQDPDPRPWDDIVDLIEMQSHDPAKRDLMKLFGIDPDQ